MSINARELSIQVSVFFYFLSEVCVPFQLTIASKNSSKIETNFIIPRIRCKPS